MKPGLPIARSSLPRGTLDGVEAFARVADRRSFSAAAVDLGVSPSAISQTIRSLEERVGVPLLTRTTRSVGLTQAGELFLERARPALDGLGAAFDAARSLGDRPAGRLRITLPRGVVPHLFSPILAGFCAAYPSIELDICGEDGFVDIVAGGYDAGVRLGEAIAADMVAVRLSDPFAFIVAGTPAYLDAAGRPERPADLRDHRCIRLRVPSGGIMEWAFMDGNRPVSVDVTGPVIVNDFNSLIVAVETGVGLAYLAEPNVGAQLQDGRLEQVLARHTLTSGGVFLYYPSRKQVMPKLRAFIDYVRDHLSMSITAAR